MARDWDSPCTRLEAEANERAKGMRCRGPYLAELTPLAYNRIPLEVQTVLRALATPASGEARRSPAELVAALLIAGHQREARLLDDALRVPCGADFADIVLANPLDGCEREYECPLCGVRGRYTAPLYNVVDTR
jgi:hypothetical protein